MTHPLMSIVIATHNSADVLSTCLSSLAEQTCRDFEVLIQDGASTDGTPDITATYAATLPFLHITSEADAGIYDAWNKVLPRIRGEWTLFLGSDDTLADPHVLERCAAALKTAPKQTVFACGDVVEIYPDGTMDRQSAQAEGALARMGEQIPFCHSSLWHRTSLFSAQNFSTDFRIAADYDFICRTWKHDQAGMTLGFTVTHMHRGGLSSHPKTRLRTLWELARIAARHGYPVLTKRRIVPLFKATLLWGICALCGTKGPARLDRLRIARGLPPCWTTTATPHEHRKIR